MGARSCFNVDSRESKQLDEELVEHNHKPVSWHVLPLPRVCQCVCVLLFIFTDRPVKLALIYVICRVASFLYRYRFSPRPGWKIRLNSDMLTNSISANIKMDDIWEIGGRSVVMVVVLNVNDVEELFFSLISGDPIRTSYSAQIRGLLFNFVLQSFSPPIEYRFSLSFFPWYLYYTDETSVTSLNFFNQIKISVRLFYDPVYSEGTYTVTHNTLDVGP